MTSDCSRSQAATFNPLSPWRAMRSGSDDLHGHTVRTWTEFVKAMYVVDPLYYQHDRTRVAVMARDAVAHAGLEVLQGKTLDNEELLRDSCRG